MKKQNSKEIGKAVRVISGLEPCSGKMPRLKYDPIAGEFVETDEIDDSEALVTEMAKDGFAAMSPERLEAEKCVLAHYLPQNTYKFNLDDVDPHVLIAAKTNCKNKYTLRIDLDEFPENVPRVEVVKKQQNKNGEYLDSCSGAMHTLTPRHGGTAICHCGASDWTPMVSLYKVFIRCRFWLEMLELHRETGKPIDYYLKHAS